MAMKTRFAPSPTGQMHLGNVRTALFSFLLAQQHEDTFLLRIEDTDAARSQTQFTDLLLTDLQWLALNWQEGPIFQSQRQTIYDHYYQALAKVNQVYPCFCTEDQLALSRKLQLAAGQPPRYAGTCQHLSEQQIEAKRATGLKPALRFKVPANQEIIFEDLVKGVQKFRSDEIGDFIIRRADGSPAFFFCNAIDDAELKVSHVLRGEDHLSNTPRQLLLLQALNLPLPHYGHIPLILGSDGSPLSKRNGSRSLQQLRQQGYLPLALLNYLSRLGHYYTNPHFMDLPELITQFSLAHIGKTPAHFDEQQLLHWQKLAVNALSESDFITWLSDDIKQIVPAEKWHNFITLIKPNILFPEEAKTWATILFKPINFTNDIKNLLQTTPKDFFKTIHQAVQAKTDYNSLIKILMKDYRGKQLFQPLRAVLTGQLQGPELITIFNLLETATILERLQWAESL